MKEEAPIQKEIPILESPSDENIRRVIAAELPELSVTSLAIIEDGYDFVVADVSGEYILRFPREDDAEWAVEIAVLNALKGKISLEIPRISHEGRTCQFLAYPKIQGEQLTPTAYREMSSDQQESVARALSRFFVELHSAVSRDEAQKMGVKPARSNALSPEAVAALNELIGAKLVERIFSEYAPYASSTSSDEVLLHDDVQHGNIIVNSEGTVKGIIDFTDIVIGPPLTEFTRLYRVDAELARRASVLYEESTGRLIPFEQVRTDAHMKELVNVWHAIEENREHLDPKHSPASHLEYFKRWFPEQ